MASWYDRDAQTALHAVSSRPEGLSAEEAAQRLEAAGPNRLETVRPVPGWKQFLRQFDNLLIYILLAAAAVTALLRHWNDTGVILAVVVINAAIGFLQERKAERALEAIRQLLAPQANVLRDGQPRLLPAASLVPGDIVLLFAGDKVPADLRLLEAHCLTVQEAVLTGESLEVEKSTAPVGTGAALGDRLCMAYAGTLVAAGQGKGVVVATGEQTEIGKIGRLVAGVETPQTPLTRKIARFGRYLSAAILGISALVFALGYWLRDIPLQEMFMVVIGIAVAAIPEGLPTVISITLALGVRAMARRNAIVRHLPVVEALGNVTVVCTDKTGTLTRNELSVSDVVTSEHHFEVTGAGYAPDGKILFEQQEILLTGHPVLGALTRAAGLNNDASLCLREGVWELNGEPTEGALMTLAVKAGHEGLAEAWPRRAVIPFSAEQRYMATLHHGEGRGVIYVKGAPERLLEMCDMQAASGGNQPLDRSFWQERVAAMAREGKRVLAIAEREAGADQEALAHGDVAGGLTLLGLVGIMDAPRKEARQAIADCIGAGVMVKMITGDHALTASAIGRQLGIPNAEAAMTGSDVERLSDTALEEAVEQVNIYARMHPEHKLRLVEALQRRGHVAAMTGDGVNDAPALKRADIGIAMGRKGTEAAKEASQIVLADDNFASIVHAIEAGRSIYANLRRTIVFMLATDLGEASSLVLAILLGLALPMTPLQILWVNMITAVTLCLAFAFAPDDPRVMQRLPLPVKAPFFSRLVLLRIVAVSLAFAGGTLGIYLYEMHHGGGMQAAARTMAVNLLVMFQVAYLLIIYPRGTRGRWRQWMPAWLAIAAVLAFQLVFTYAPFMQRIFATAPMTIGQWGQVIVVAALLPVAWGVDLAVRKGAYRVTLPSVAQAM